MSYFNYTSPTEELYREYRTFNYHWDSYTPEEREILLKDFKNRLYNLGNDKPLEI